MKKLAAIGIGMTLSLMGCEGDAVPENDLSKSKAATDEERIERIRAKQVIDDAKEAKEQWAAVPDFVKEIAATDFPADGKLHVETRGKFVVNANTQIRQAGRYRHPSLPRDREMNLGLLGHPIGDPGPEHRGKPLKHNQPGFFEYGRKLPFLIRPGRSHPLANGAETKPDEIPNFSVYSRVEPNRNGKPYRATLMIWQKRTVWVGRIEYPNLGKYDTERGYRNRDVTAPESYGYVSPSGNTGTLSYAFVDYLESGL